MSNKKQKQQLEEFVLKNIRQANGLEENDTSRDDMFNKEKDRKWLFKMFMQWYGIIGYESTIIRAIENIYDVKLENKE